MRKILSLLTVWLVLLSSMGNAVLAFEPQEAITKLTQLKIVNNSDGMDSNISYAVGATYVLRTRMLLDYKFWLAPVYKKYTNNNVLDATLNTLDVFSVSYNKTNPQETMTSETMKNVIKSILWKEDTIVDYDSNWKLTKKEVIVTLYGVYEKVKGSNFDNLENDLGIGDLDDLFGDLEDTLTDEGETDKEEWDTSASTWNVKFEVVWPDTIKVTDAEDYTFKDAEWNTLAVKDWFVTLKNPATASVKVYKDWKVYDEISGFGFSQEWVFMSSDTYDQTLLKWTNVVWKLYVKWKHTIGLETRWLFDNASMWKLIITNESYKTLKEFTIKSWDEYTYEFDSGTDMKVLYILAENETNMNEFRLLVYKGDIKDENKIWENYFKAYTQTNWNIQINIDSNATTPSKDIWLDDTLKLGFKLQNLDDESVVLRKFVINGDWHLEVNKLVVKDDKGTEYKDYQITLDREDIIVYLPDNKTGIEIKAAETKALVVELSSFYGEEGDNITYSLSTKDFDYLFETVKRVGKFSYVNLATMLSWYGTYTLKETSILLSTLSTINTKIPVGTDVVLYRWKIENIGDVYYSSGKVRILPWSAYTINDITNKINNVKLVYCDYNTNNMCGDTYTSVDLDTSLTTSWNELVADFAGSNNFKSWRYIYEVRGDLNEWLDWKAIKVKILWTDYSFENKDGDDVAATWTITSQDLQIQKWEVEFIIPTWLEDNVVNTTTKLGTITIQNIGWVDIRLNRINVDFLKYNNATSAYVAANEVQQLYLIEDTTGDDIENKTKLTPVYNTTSKTAQELVLNEPITISKNAAKNFAIVWVIDWDKITSYPYQFRLNHTANSIVTTTTTWSEIKNTSWYQWRQYILHKSGLVEVATDIPTDAEEGGKIKDIVSPADNEILLWKFTVLSNYEDVRIDKVMLKDLSANNWLKNIKTLRVRDVANTTSVPLGSTTVSSNPTTVTIPMNNATVLKSATAWKTFFVYGRLLTNSEWFTSSTSNIVVEDVEAYWAKSWNQLTGVTAKTINNTNYKAIKYYPAIPTAEVATMTGKLTPWSNRDIIKVTIRNDDDKAIQIDNFKIEANRSDVQYSNIRLVNDLYGTTIATITTLPESSKWITFENVWLKVNAWSSARLVIKVDAYSISGTGNSESIFYYGDKDSSTEDYSVEYCALEWSSCISWAGFTLANNHLWFVKWGVDSVSLDVFDFEDKPLSCTATAPILNEKDGSVSGNANANWYVWVVSVTVWNIANFVNTSTFNSNKSWYVNVDITWAVWIASVDYANITYSDATWIMTIPLVWKTELNTKTQLSWNIKVKLSNNCGILGSAQTITLVDNIADYVYGVSFVEKTTNNDNFFDEVNDKDDELTLYFTDAIKAWTYGSTGTFPINRMQIVWDSIILKWNATPLFTITSSWFTFWGDTSSDIEITANNTWNALKVTQVSGNGTTLTINTASPVKVNDLNGNNNVIPTVSWGNLSNVTNITNLTNWSSAWYYTDL